MKPIIILLIFFLFISCSSKEDLAKNLPDLSYQEEQDTSDLFDQEEQNTSDLLDQEEQDTSYIFDIDTFGFLEEFPFSILEIKAMYPDENFEERTSESDGRGVPLGNYAYTLRSDNIHFYFWGNTIEDAALKVVEVINPQYQCKTMQVIGMTAEELENLSGKKLDLDKKIIIFTKLYSLTIQTKDGTVQSYTIVAQL
jgi:hypothetical protein